ncbi:hypothetical protein BCAH1134_C0114 (plasmid) [Bacillus cereus AH1134]|nr:hypothetical protein BCAH1134_C0114 [Bacillus cereus AH1134]
MNKKSNNSLKKEITVPFHLNSHRPIIKIITSNFQLYP